MAGLCLGRCLDVTERDSHHLPSPGGPRADVAPGHPPPRPRQRLQQCPLQRSVLGTVEAERHRHVHHDLHLHGVQHHPRVRHRPLHPRLRARQGGAKQF